MLLLKKSDNSIVVHMTLDEAREIRTCISEVNRIRMQALAENLERNKFEKVSSCIRKSDLIADFFRTTAA